MIRVASSSHSLSRQLSIIKGRASITIVTVIIISTYSSLAAFMASKIIWLALISLAAFVASVTIYFCAHLFTQSCINQVSCSHFSLSLSLSLALSLTLSLLFCSSNSSWFRVPIPGTRWSTRLVHRWNWWCPIWPTQKKWCEGKKPWQKNSHPSFFHSITIESGKRLMTR